MTIKVFAWPPVRGLGREWTILDPVARLRSTLTGRDQMQASQPRRRMATIEVSSLGSDEMGAGYCEMLKQFLEGGVHAVRLRSFAINRNKHECWRRGAAMNSEPLVWQTGPDPLAWQTGGERLRWFSGTVAVGGTPTMVDGWPRLRVDGLPPDTLVARPGDFIRVYEMDDHGTYEIARVVKPCTTTAGGTAYLRTDRLPTISGGRVNMGGQDEGVFRVDGALPRAVQPVRGDWSYTWSFREVFAGEVGGFEELDPWT